MQTRANFSQPAANSQGDQSVPSLTGTPETIASGVTQEFHNFVADVEDLVSKTTSLTGEDLTRAKAKLVARVAAAKESLQEISSDLVQRARKTNSYVHDQPWQAIGIGAAVGVLLGFVLGRRK